MNIASSRHRVGSFLLGGGFAMLVVMSLLFPGITPWADAKTPGPGAKTPSICTVHYFAFDSPKESKNAFGPRVASRDEASIKAQLNERRLCGKDNLGDPALTAAHYAGWSAEGLTRQKVSFAGIDAFASKLAADQTLWTAAVSEMDSLENASAFSLASIPAGSPSLYMVPSASGVATLQGVTVRTGAAVVFTHGSAVVKFRLDCGFQNIRPSFPGLKTVPPGSPEQPKQPTQPTQPKQPTHGHPGDVTHHSTCPSGQVLNVNHVCVTPKTNVFRAPGQDNTTDSGVGTKPVVPVVTTPASPPAKVITSQTGGGGVVDTATNQPGSATGVTAPGAVAPAPVRVIPPPVVTQTEPVTGTPVNPFQ